MANDPNRRNDGMDSDEIGRADDDVISRSDEADEEEFEDVEEAEDEEEGEDLNQ